MKPENNSELSTSCSGEESWGGMWRFVMTALDSSLRTFGGETEIGFRRNLLIVQ